MAAVDQVKRASDRFYAALTRVKTRHAGPVVIAAAVLGCVGVASSLLGVSPPTSAAPIGVHPFAAGTVVVSQGGTIFGGVGGGTGVTAHGAVDLYPPDATGDAAPEASVTQSMDGPTTLAFDPAGDLWVANENTSTLVEFSRAQLVTPNPAPRVTISAAGGALANPFGLAFDRQGDLWVVGNAVGRVYEYTEEQLAHSGAPTPRTTLADFPGLPLGDAFDAHGDLWVTTNVSPQCPQGCVVEFARDALALPNPAPTVTLSSTGGANLAFTPMGNLWLVTGGGPNCFGTPCSNELVEFTKAQLSSSGAPTPAVTISSTTVGSVQSLDGPYGVAVAPSGAVWVSNFDNNTTVEYGKDQLSTSGAPTPRRVIVGLHSGMNFPSFVVVAP